MSNEIKEYYPGSEYQRLFSAITNTNGTALESEMDDIIRIVHEDFKTTSDYTLLSDELFEWSNKTFGERPLLPLAYHLKKEVRELIDVLELDPENWRAIESELADIFLLITDLCRKHGLTPDGTISNARGKFEKVKQREWGQPDANGVIEHIKPESNLITDDQLDKAWGNANFGNVSKCEVVIDTLKKVAQGWGTGHTAMAIVKELGLVESRSSHNVLTDKGLLYLLHQSKSDTATEREVMIHVFAQVRNLFERRSWIMEGRGSYPYNDDRYKEEVRYLYEEFDAIDRALWKNIKSKTFEYRNSIIAEAKNEISDMRIRATLGFAKWCFENSVILASDGKWYYEADMLQHAAMGEEETWTDGTKELPAYSDEQIFKSYIESLMEVRHDQS